jgi:hypothetical protein
VKKHSTTENTVNNFDSNEASSIKIVKEMFSSNLSGNLTYIKSKFGGISTTISHLEAVCVEMHDDMVLVKRTECEVGHTRGKVRDSVKSKV